MGVSLSVQVMRGGQTLATHQFDSDSTRTIKIGRLSSAQVKLEDAKVARIHAVIEFAGVDASLIDMGSTQGSLVNGAKVNKVKLNHGDQIQLGDTVLLVGLGAAVVGTVAPAQVPTPAAAQATTVAPAIAYAQPAYAGAGAPVGAITEAARAPSFDPGQSEDNAPVRRITQDRLRSAAVESRPHPALAPEEPLSQDNRVLELRYYWGEVLLGMYHYTEPKAVTIGENTRTNIFISSEGLPKETFPLVRFLDGEYVLTYAGTMEGELEVGGTVHSLQDAKSGLAKPDGELADAYQVKMPQDCRAVVHWGGATFALRFVPPPQLQKAPFGKNVDLPSINCAVLSMFVHTAIIVTLSIYPHDTEALKVDLFGEPDRFASLILEAPKEDEKKTQDLLKKLQKTQEEKKEQVKVEQQKEKPKPLDTKNIVVPKNVPKPQPSKEQRKEEIAQKFSKLFGGGGGGGSLLGGGGGGSLSGTLQNVIGTAGSGSSSAGLAGLGIRGTGPLTGGGIGTSRGIAGIGTTGRLGGGGAGYGAGVGLGAVKSRSMIDLDTPNVEGALAADVIKKVINQNKNQVRYCYEVELQRNQNLEGRVLVSWIIGGTGAVVSANIKDSSLHNASVEDCLLKKIKAWVFPPPAGGGTVAVNYPFVFKAS